MVLANPTYMQWSKATPKDPRTMPCMYPDLYAAWLWRRKFLLKQEAARSITFGTPLSALLKTIYLESWD
jgi:hypothetical protein